jgi:UrcA family protein
MSRIFLSILPLAALTSPVMAQADLETRVVAVADLNLASDSGKLALNQRLTRAVIEVCGTASDVDLAGKNDVRACRDRTLAEARAAAEQRIVARSADAIRIAAR